MIEIDRIDRNWLNVPSLVVTDGKGGCSGGVFYPMMEVPVGEDRLIVDHGGDLGHRRRSVLQEVVFPHTGTCLGGDSVGKGIRS